MKSPQRDVEPPFPFEGLGQLGAQLEGFLSTALPSPNPGELKSGQGCFRKVALVDVPATNGVQQRAGVVQVAQRLCNLRFSPEKRGHGLLDRDAGIQSPD